MIQSTIFSGLQDIVTTLVGVLVAFVVAYIKQHFSASQISTGAGIASEAVNFAAQAAKKLGITEDSAKYTAALTKAKELASKAGLNFTDSQWETLLESAYLKGKNGLQTGLQSLVTPIITEPQNATFQPVSVDSGVVTPVSTIAVSTTTSTAPKSIAEVVNDTLDQVGEQAKTQAVHDLTAKISAVVQEASAPVSPVV